MNKNSVNPEEIEKFSNLSNEWWDPNGKFKVLHDFNKPRTIYISKMIKEILKLDIADKSSCKKLKALDIGCGGGILTESIAKMGFNTTGIDASEKSIMAAKIHAEKEKITNIKYEYTTAEELLKKEPEKYDIIFALEIIEHVNDPEEFVSTITSLLKPKGVIFISTINRNLKSLLTAKIAAEYILKWLPKNTHDFKKFLSPAEIDTMLTKNNCSVKDVTGVKYNICNQEWELKRNPDINYICCAIKGK